MLSPAGPMLSPWLVLQKAAARGWRSLQHASLCRCLVPVPVCTLRRYWDSVNGLAAIRTCLGAAEEQWYLNATGSGIPAVWIVDCCTTNDGRACQSYLSPQGDFQLPVVRTVRCATVHPLTPLLRLHVVCSAMGQAVLGQQRGVRLR